MEVYSRAQAKSVTGSKCKLRYRSAVQLNTQNESQLVDENIALAVI